MRIYYLFEITLEMRLPSISLLFSMWLSTWWIRNRVIQIKVKATGIMYYVANENRENAVTHLQRGNVVHGWSSARSPRVTAGMFSGGRSPLCTTPADPCRPIRATPESAIQPSNEGCNRGHMMSLASGAVRSSGWSLMIVRHSGKTTRRRSVTKHFAIALANAAYDKNDPSLWLNTCY